MRPRRPLSREKRERRPPESSKPRLEFIAQLLHGYGSLVHVGKVAASGTDFVADFYGDVSNEHAMLSPEILDLSLTAINEVIQIVDKEDPFAGRDRRAASTEQNIVSALRG